ncbi:MAG: tetratricopeptide repeat protein, partial [Pseudomonadota bacterium]
HEILRLEFEPTSLEDPEYTAAVRSLNYIIKKLATDVHPILKPVLSRQKELTKETAIEVLQKINDTLKNKIDVVVVKEGVLLLSRLLKPTTVSGKTVLKADCDTLSIIYYSVLKDVFRQNVVLVKRPGHVHVKWKLNSADTMRINWETTSGAPFSEEDYIAWLKSSYALELDHKGVIALGYFNRAKVKYISEDHMGAIQDYTEAIRLNPKDAAAYNNRGNVKAELNYNEDAVQDYNMAIGLDPEYLDAYYNRKEVRFKLNDFKGAAEDLKKISELKGARVH